MEHKFLASFDKYHADGTRVRFSIADDDANDHHKALHTYLHILDGMGYTTTPPGMEDGEEMETIGGWVLGETSTDQPCLFLYADNPGMQYRVSTIFEEHIEEMPFKVDTNTDRWNGQAPTREIAEKKKFFTACTPFQIVNKPTGKTTDAGKAITKFNRVVGQTPAPAPAPAPAPEVRFQQPAKVQAQDTPGWTFNSADAILASGNDHAFTSAEDAIAWALALNVPDAAKWYAKLKTDKNPKSAAQMWALWLDYCASVRLAQQSDQELWTKDQTEEQQDIPF